MEGIYFNIYCNMEKLKFLEKARLIHGYKYEYINLPDKILYNDYVSIMFNGVLYKQRVVKHIMMCRCPEKDIPLSTTDDFISKSIKVWGDKYDYSLVDYKGSGIKVKIIYDGIIYEQTPSAHLKKWSVEKQMNKEAFLKKSKELWGDKYDYSLVEYTTIVDKVKIIYNNNIYEQTPRQHLKCSPENTKYTIGKTKEQFIHESNIVHDFKYNYDRSNYIKSNSKLIITCPIHGDFKQRPADHINGVGCPSCNDSKGEREIYQFLKQYNIRFYRQYKFSDCINKQPLPFDFYIESIRTCIEFDGIQHFQPIEYFGGLSKYESLKINDKIKNDYCEDNYIDLIRIRYDQIDRIFDILKESLKNKI